MAVTVVYEVPGMTADQYDDVIAQLEATGLGAPDGRRYHVASALPVGWFVVDVFDSKDQLDRFLAQLGPMLGAAGVGRPEIKVLPTHNLIGG